ncbi:MAG TPA: 2-phospho-L-lactate transferase [Candidatus Limnocylindria bacterium]|nr:2-phospho-L-lactate transferase [Candidatus Limnocylindria bacterium]
MSSRVTVLAGGVGGAKMAHGFQQVLAEGDLSVVVNVADDFEVFGLHISPDLDTVMYTLAGVANPITGWGIRDDTHRALEMLGRLGGDTWFSIGDADLATHLRRTRLLADGCSLTDATRSLATALGVPSHVLPATDQQVATMLATDAGELDFQTYFVRRGQRDEVRAVRFDGLDDARPSAAALAAIRDADLVVLAPSNPIVSIGPILELDGMRQAVAASRTVAVSPIVAGRALKGPADRMLASLGHESTALGVARLYAGLVDRFVLDEADAALAPAVEALGMAVDVLPTVMHSDADRAAVGRAVLELA